MKFIEFISTERKKYLEKYECIKLLKENCLKSIRNRSIFYRGYSSDSTQEYMLLNGSAGVRNSKMGNNNLLIYTNELYKDDPLYQDRSKCTIMSTEKIHSKRFGEIYCIIPYDDAILSYTTDYADMNHMRYDYKNKHGYPDDISITSLFIYLERCSNFNELMKTIEHELKTDNAFTHFDDIAHLIDKKDPINSFKKIFNKNVISINSVKSTNFLSSKMHEVWTEGKCIAIKEDMMEEIIKELKKE